MAFPGGTIHVICPACGAPVAVDVMVDWVHLSQYNDNSGNLTLGFNNSSATHRCKKVT